MSEHNRSEVRDTGERERDERPRIYVASLSDYNAGRLHGDWIAADQTVEELHEAVSAMLARSPEPVAEEWAIHDYEGFGNVRLSEYESLESVSRVAVGIAEHGPAFAAWASTRDLLDDESLDGFEEGYLGTWESVEQYAESLLDDVGATAELAKLPEWLQPHVALDVEGFANDLVLGGDIRTVEDENGVHVFDGRA